MWKVVCHCDISVAIVSFRPDYLIELTTYTIYRDNNITVST